MKNFLLGMLVMFAILVGSAGIYFGGKQLAKKTAMKSPSITDIQKSPTILAPTLPPLPTSSSFVNPSVTIETIKEAIPSKSYSDLAGVMSDQVTVTLYASECCGPMSKTKVIAQLAYLSGATSPWNFEDSNPVAVKLTNAQYANLTNDAIIGTSDNFYAVAFKLNDVYLIEKIWMTNNYRLLIQ